MLLLKNCRNGEDAVYETSLKISKNGDEVTFEFDCKNSKCYCPHDEYNDFHCEGDVCEIFIGSSRERNSYYEMQLSPENKLFLGKITYKGWDEENQRPLTDLELIPTPFVKTKTNKTDNGYSATLTFSLSDVNSGDGEFFFNAFRIDTDGGETEKHLFSLYPTYRPKFHVPQYFGYLKDAVDA